MKTLYESLINEWRQDSYPQAIVVMGGPGAGKTYWMNKYAKEFFQKNIEFKKLDSDHNLEKYQREHLFTVAEDLIQATSMKAISQEANQKKAFMKTIKDLQREMDEQCKQNGSPSIDLSVIDFKFVRSWADRLDRAIPDKQADVMALYKDAFYKEYFKTLFASDFSVRHMSKAEYKKDFQTKLGGTDYEMDFVGPSDVVVAITGDEIKKFEDIISVCGDTHAVSVVYLNVPAEMSVRQDAQRDRSLGEKLVRKILGDVQETWEELTKKFKDIGIWKMYEMVPEDPNQKYIKWKLNKTYVNTDMIKKGIR